MQEEHAKLIRRLCKPGDEILESLTPAKCHMWHMTSCLLGEAVELEQGIAAKDTYNIIEELGDMQFYLLGFITHLGRLFIYFPPKKSVGVSVAAADLFDIVKKHVIYGKDLDYGRIMEAINQIRFEMIRIRSDFGVHNDTVIKANIDKLNRRYPTGGYQNADAIARADKGEGSGGKMVDNVNERFKDVPTSQPGVCHLCNDCGFPGVSCMECGKEDCPPKDPPTVNLMGFTTANIDYGDCVANGLPNADMINVNLQGFVGKPPSRWRRLMDRIFTRKFGDLPKLPEWAKDGIIPVVAVRLSFQDRLRVLLRGRFSIRVCVACDKLPEKWETIETKLVTQYNNDLP